METIAVNCDNHRKYKHAERVKYVINVKQMVCIVTIMLKGGTVAMKERIRYAPKRSNDLRPTKQHQAGETTFNTPRPFVCQDEVADEA